MKLCYKGMPFNRAGQMRTDSLFLYSILDSFVICITIW